ncbi:MAG: SMC-Scp complex subunit ScpB [Planctomycetota bacterium]
MTDTHDQDPISLDELAQAFAQVMGAPPQGHVVGQVSNLSRNESPQPPVGEAATEADKLQLTPRYEPAAAVDKSMDDDSGPLSPLGILEAMLFVGDRDSRPLTAVRAAELMRGVEPGEIGGLIEELNRRYTQSGCPYFVAEDSDGYRITLRKPFHPLRELFYSRIREARLSQAAIDVLAVVAYRQPLSAEQIGAVRGKPSGPVLSQLVHRGLLRIERLPGKRRMVQYFTTDRFLQLFGLQTLADLPQSEELDRQ